jgi:hypothetical protein
MQLAVVLKRIGAEVVKESIKDTDATLYLRVDPDQGEKWVEVVTAFLMGSQDKPYTVDVSKYFFVSKGAIRYLWRVVLTGEVTTALMLFGSCALEIAQSRVVQFDSFPLVGRATYPFNPAKGQLKGGHDLQQSPGILSMAIAGVPGVS